MPLKPNSATFTATAWTMIQAAQKNSSNEEQKQACLEYLLETYSPAIRAFIFKAGVLDPHWVDDFQQGFVQHFLQKDLLEQLNPSRGRFRGFLHQCVKNYVYDELRKKQRVISISSLSAKEGEADLQLDDPSPQLEDHYNKEWAKALMRHALKSFQDHCRESDLPHYAEVFQRHVLQPEGFQNPSQKQTAQALDKTPKEIENILRRSKKLFKEKVYSAVRATISSEEELEQEISDLRDYFGGLA